jgi:hypothetical protein
MNAGARRCIAPGPAAIWRRTVEVGKAASAGARICARYALDMDEDWRVRLTLHDWPRVKQKSSGPSLTADLTGRLGADVRVTSGGTAIFLYASTADAAADAARAAQDVLAGHMVSADVRLEHWNPGTEQWQDNAVMPWDAAAEQAALAEVRERERRWSARTGQALWEVRVELASPDEVAALARYLASQGWPVIRRRRYLVAGADSEDDANSLAQEIRESAGADAVTSVKKSIWGWGGPLLPQYGATG